MLGLRKPNLKTKIIQFEKSQNAGNCKRGHFEIFLNILFFAKFQKKKRDLKNSAKKMRIFNSLIVPKNLEEGTIWNFLTFVLLQNTKKMMGGIFGDMKKNCEKKSQSRNNMHKKFWLWARLEPTSFCLADLK